MGDIVKLALRLFIFAFVASVLLAMTNEVTKDPIEKQKLASKMAALKTVLPGCEYEQIEYEGLADDSVLDEIFAGKDADGNVKGYALTANPQGYGGEIPITLGVSVDGYVTQTYVGSLQETQGLGSRVGDDAFKEQFIAIAADPDTLRSDVDTIAGATISSSAFVNAVEQMLVYTKNTLGIEPHAGDKEAVLAEATAANGGDAEEEAAVETTTASYDVTGFAPFKVEITVDSNGKIVSVTVPENSETAGFGADLIADTSVFDALVGQDIATAQIDVKSGVTLTSNAINDALSQAAAAFGGAAEGEAKAYDVTGFAPFKVEIAVDDEGKIVSVSVPENNETAGFGADLIADQSIFDALVGQDIATAQIDMKSGVTLTSNAINDALKQAAADFGGAEDAAPAIAGDPYTVKGMNKFTMYVEVADGKIVSVSAPNNSETPGLGADMLTDDALSALVGQELATAQVDVKSGVTLTSNAINDALKQAAVANGIVIAEPTVEPTVEPTAEPVVEPTADEAAATELTMYDVTGFAPFKVGIAVDGDGKIVSVSIPENNETAGFGADLIADQSVFGALVGQDIATAQIDVKSGVTLTSNAINDALKQAAAANETETVEPTAESAVEATVYEVTGMYPLKVAIAVDESGKIVSVTVPESNETPGFGADLIADQSIFDALVGQDIATAQIDVKAGVTLTSNAINDALKQAAANYGNAATDAEAESATSDLMVGTYDVTGMYPIKVEIVVDGNGKIVSVTVPESNETPGFGADLIADQSIFDALVGQDIATAQIDVKSGVTLTSNAINDALKQAAKEVQ